MKRIVIKVQVESEKCRNKALKVAAKSQGVVSLSLEGQNRDQVVVTGDGVDAVHLTNQLRKKFRHTTLVSVEDMEEDEDEEEEVEEEEENEEEEEATSKENSSPSSQYDNYPPPPCPICITYLPRSPMYSHVVYDSYPNGCTIV